MRTYYSETLHRHNRYVVGMKPLSERDENLHDKRGPGKIRRLVGMKPLSERDENTGAHPVDTLKPTNL